MYRNFVVGLLLAVAVTNAVLEIDYGKEAENLKQVFCNKTMEPMKNVFFDCMYLLQVIEYENILLKCNPGLEKLENNTLSNYMCAANKEALKNSLQCEDKEIEASKYREKIDLQVKLTTACIAEGERNITTTKAPSRKN
ncbi:uncharacterized protein LOC129226113 [Uloborus diversus]|uniref:uncharacterized protein LOC129226113 n=1 Tax=Uloborus diversus TaxID=327109 RepID=UPI00240A8032|nr:uncharacterized protein LOC129226113 [Uloborus diversus]